MPRFSDVEPLSSSHDVQQFDSGVGSLDTWLRRYALQASAVGSARTYVTVDRNQRRVVGFHALAAAAVDPADATPRAAKGMPRHPVPAALLARLAVDVSVQGQGIGAWLLADAMLRALNAAEAVGIRLLLVHALDEGARSFYVKHGFEPSPTDPFNLQMLIKDIRASVGRLTGA